jgi:putative membrane-bound dehydrogenase-like protein
MNPAHVFWSASLAIWALVAATDASWAAEKRLDANRLAYLDQADPFHPNLQFPKLTTPQWVGEPGVDAVIILSIDDMSGSARYEQVLRPILERLKQIEGRAPLSILCVSPKPDDSQLQAWLKEGLSLEVHTLNHPCPCLQKGSFADAEKTFHGCVELLNRIPNNQPVAFRMPCCDSINSPSPRFYAEIFNHTNSAGQFLTIDSSVMNITTTNDAILPRSITIDPALARPSGRERFRKYVPFPAFATVIEDYPYPYTIGDTIWEFPCAVPSDWEAQHLHGTNNPATVADWKAAIDATVAKQGVFTLVFHPHGWILNSQIVELIDYAVSKYGKRIKFLNFREAQERLNKNLLTGQPIRGRDGRANGVRILDINNDGFMDVVIGNGQLRKTRVWQPKERNWKESDFPVELVERDSRDSGVRFGIVETDGFASCLSRDEKLARAFHFDSQEWVENKSLLEGLELDGQPVLTRKNGIDTGFRFIDVDHDGRCEAIIGNDTQNAAFEWSGKSWERLPFALPEGTMIVDGRGTDAGLRFVDVNDDGFPDIIYSNEKTFSLHLFLNQEYVGLPRGWTMKIRSGKRGDTGEIPMISRGGEHPNNGAWFRNRELWVQNEDTASKTNLVERRSFDGMLALDAAPAKSPEESLACIRVRPGFKAELVAAEPLVKDPIAFEWGADGKLWVAEMGDYPLGVDGHGKPGGIVRFLTDTKGDGRYDKSTIFLDALAFPNGIYPWRKGVIISCPPDIIYAEDTDGDGKADVKKRLFTGFHPGNQQHRANGYDYGLDNWLYGANGESGGQVISFLAGKKVDINGRDFRFRPDTGEFESESGQTQYGRHRDDWGNWFGTNNPKWLWHYLFAERYIARNRNLPVRENKRELANYEDSGRVHSIAPEVERFNDPNGADHVTSGNSPMPYRDELFGLDFATSVFTSEPVHNCVHREVLEQDGVTFKSHRAKGEEGSEFVASTDNWFRPTMLKTGPDGALYIADMYRLVIEHPEWISPERQKRINLRAGDDKGRLYRVYPVNAKLRPVPRLDKMGAAELVTALDSPSGWQRDTAQRLLVERADKTAVAPLEKLAEKSLNPKARIQALCALDGLGAVTPENVVAALKDSHPIVRANAVRVSESLARNREDTRALPQVRETTSQLRPEILARALLNLTSDSDIRVRFQLAFTLGEWADPRAGKALAQVALRDSDNAQMRTAVLSSAPRHLEQMFSTILAARNPPAALVESLFALATESEDQRILPRVLAQIAEPRNGNYAAWQFAALAGLLDALERRGQNLAQLRDRRGGEVKDAINQLEPLFAKARNAVTRPTELSAPFSELRLLGRGVAQTETDISRLGDLLSPQLSSEIQRTALAALKTINRPTVAETLISHWTRLGPELRGEAVGLFFSRSSWLNSLMDALDQARIPKGQIASAQQQQLLSHKDAKVKERAAKLFHVNADRQKIIEAYAGVGTLKGNPTKGHVLFKQICAACHRVKDEGNAVGPDLGMMSDKPVSDFVTAILDPNRSVETRYVNYTALLKSDREISGVIVTENANSVTFKSSSGPEETILRADIEELRSSGLSLMPEGLENALKPQDFADVISYLKAK